MVENHPDHSPLIPLKKELWVGEIVLKHEHISLVFIAIRAKNYVVEYGFGHTHRWVHFFSCHGCVDVWFSVDIVLMVQYGTRRPHLTRFYGSNLLPVCHPHPLTAVLKLPSSNSEQHFLHYSGFELEIWRNLFDLTVAASLLILAIWD